MEIQSSTSDVFNQTTPINSSGLVSDSSASSVGSSGNNTPVTDTTKKPEQGNLVNTSGPLSDFGAYLKTALGGDSKSQVSEEELFAGLIQQRLSAKSEEAGTFYAAEKEKLIASRRRADGYVPYEEIGLQALNSAVAAGKLTKEEAEMVNGEAFMGAQLDSNLDSLYDDRGGENDSTMAVSAMVEALSKSQSIIDGILDGTKKAVSRSLDAGPTGAAGSAAGAVSQDGSPTAVGSGNVNGEQQLDGSGGFLWKPVSDSDSKLAVLLPQALAGMVEKLEIHSSLPPSESTKLAAGDYKYDSNGGRPTFRFSKPGEDYGDNIHVVAFKKDGTTATWEISDGSKRND